MKDAFGAEVNVGDTVAYIDGYGGSKRYLRKGKVTKVSPARIIIGYETKKPSYVAVLKRAKEDV